MIVLQALTRARHPPGAVEPPRQAAGADEAHEMPVTKPDAPDLDLRSRANLRDPYPAHRWLRDHDPVHWSDGLQGWIVSRYADVLEIFNHPERFSAERFRKLAPRFRSERAEVRAVASVLSDWLVFRDPPDHTRLRNLLQKTFTPRHLEKNRDGIQITVDSLLDRVAERGEMDFMRDFAFPLPAIVIAILLGAPKEDIEPIKLWSDRLAAHVGGAVDGRDNFSEAKAGLDDLVAYFRTLLAERRRRPGDDLMSLLLRAEHEGERLSEEEVVSNCVLLLFAGHETTTNLLGNGLYHLLCDPETERALRDRPDLVESAVEEFLRLECPVAATIKVAMQDFEWHGAHIQRGERLIPFMASANRDPRQFEHPDSLDIARRPNRHLAFGYGIHFCLGAPLARLEAKLAFTTLLRRFPRLQLADPEPHWKPQVFMRGMETLPLRWQA
jgi:cytochrome P450